ncbi:heavy-metal-associated domain-containing protein [Adhaeribacter sp. BT258]|uniref:Heavy-metal-associated domain-containing protein n=1 Tax=Adhaeribacter terrigena TaxID=2793070 RepID=A0ABS1BXN5_9BACT|nr:heavy-metal-associated domain-containing protein [Adhaeribacter terrigena]MBK0401867.1 heavy-metal-associated domain-containing protein [Adhaeribacter terrigena]
MKDLKFKTNINCGSCVANISPFLDKAEGINEWKVDTTNAQKILTVSTANLNEAEVIKLVQEAGYKAEKL